jgi:hypothetical protein
MYMDIMTASKAEVAFAMEDEEEGVWSVKMKWRVFGSLNGGITVRFGWMIYDGVWCV